MKILFSFESSRMPVRSITLINWLIHRGHTVHILYEESVGHEPMSYCGFNRTDISMNHVRIIKLSKIIPINLRIRIRYVEMRWK